MKPIRLCARVVLLFCLALFTINYSAPVSAGEEVRRQTLGSDPDVYRVEIRKLEYFLVFNRSSNDDWEGEISWVELSLEADTQIHRRKQFANELRVNDGSPSQGRFIVKRSDVVRFGDMEYGDINTNVLWLHANKSRPDNPTEVEFKITVKGTGCSAPGGSCQTVNRLIFYLPVFETPPPMTCERENTFQVRSNATVTPFMNVRNMSSIGLGALLEEPRQEILLYPFGIGICIASTRPPGFSE